MRRIIFPLFTLALLAACGGPASKNGSRSVGRYGGILNFNETQPPRSLFPPAITQVSEIHVAAQIYEGLVRFNPKDLSIEPTLAESWSIDSSHKVYTFELRKGVRFQNDPAFSGGEGREFTAKDVVDCFTQLCRPGVIGQSSRLFRDRLEGVDSVSSTGLISGLQALDDHTVQIRLARPCSNFLQVLADPGCWIWPQELLTAYGKDLMHHAIGTGPFEVKATEQDEAIVLIRNEHYWGQDELGGALPYLEGVRITFVPDKEKEVAAFLKGNLSMLTELSLESMDMLADTANGLGHSGTKKFTTTMVPALATQYYGLNAMRAPFNDVRVRRAFALAIDRSVLVDSVLHGTAKKADHGLVPPGLTGYPYQFVPGIRFDPDSARRLMALAGYPNGKGFPHVQLQVNNDGFGYQQVASKVQDMLMKELKVPITVSVVSPKEYYDRIERGKALFWREGWVADLPDPGNFLALLYGKNTAADTSLPSPVNTTRYMSPRFDSVYAASMTESDVTARMRSLAEAESIAMQDVPLIPLYHPYYILLAEPQVQDLHINPMELIDLRSVWFSEPQTKVPATKP